ncbi:MAG: methionine adenosyltransferase [Clostridia bacterium]|nr:methionine adenosyltransferase [Clostridia bacterium]
MSRYFFTSESVTEGHPDKVCDQISDALVDSYLARDPNSRVACETFVTENFVGVMGEVTTNGYVDVEDVARNVIKEIGYDKDEYGFNGDNCEVLIKIHRQSSDIAMGVDTGGAGDQGLMFGYACDETEEFMPLSLVLSHKLVQKLTEVRRSGELNYLRPDGKSQVTVEYENGKIVRIDTVLISTQHDPKDHAVIERDIIEHVIKKVVSSDLIDDNTKFLVNPTGNFVIGGPAGDTGLTGRKIIVDTYGGHAAHGGGCFSGKDPSKVDRSAAYMARFLAKNIVAHGYAKQCEVQLAYAIGKAQPVSVNVNTYSTETIPLDDIEEKISKIDLTPKGIIERFDLKRPIYRQTASYGHFGRNDLNLPWEEVIKDF